MPLGVDAGCKEPFVAPCCFRHTYSDARSSWRGAVLHRLNTLEGNSILTHCVAKSSSPYGSQRRSKPNRRASVSTLSGRSNSFKGFELASMKVVTQRNSWRRGWESNPRIKVLQTSPLPLGYRASALQYSETVPHFQPGRFGRGCKTALLIFNCEQQLADESPPLQIQRQIRQRGDRRSQAGCQLLARR